MSENDALAARDEAIRREEVRKRFSMMDTDSVKQLAKESYAEIALLMAQMAPLRSDFDLATEIIQERLEKENRLLVNDPDFFIGFEVGKPGPAQKDDAALYDALHALVIDGDKLSADILKDVAWEETPPPAPPPLPVKKTNLTKLKALVKTLGTPVQEIINAHVSYPPPRRRFVFQPKEHHVNTGSLFLAGEPTDTAKNP
jgi:hypothetical protein